jgi:hypothetical protein
LALQLEGLLLVRGALVLAADRPEQARHALFPSASASTFTQ